METIRFERDTPILYVAASSFPDGIEEAHRKLHSILPSSPNRRYFAVSRPENGVIAYKAGAEELFSHEAEALKCERLILRKGNYIGITVTDYQKNLHLITETFQRILAQPGIDPQGYCVEWYVNNSDVKCLVRLSEQGGKPRLQPDS